MNYDYEKENFKKCPVCGNEIDYHTKGFYHDQVLNVWICRKHKLEEIEQHIKLQDKGTIGFIMASECELICAACAGKEPVEPKDGDIFELKACIKCGALTALELGGVIAHRNMETR